MGFPYRERRSLYWNRAPVVYPICLVGIIMGSMASQITSLTIVYSTVIRAQIKTNIKVPRHWPLCGEFTGTGEFPAQMASDAGNISIGWRHHAFRDGRLVSGPGRASLWLCIWKTFWPLIAGGLLLWQCQTLIDLVNPQLLRYCSSRDLFIHELFYDKC